MKPYITAEISANHLGSLDRALSIVDAAKVAGADAIKLQTWEQDTMVLKRSHKWREVDLFDLYRKAWLPWSFHAQIFTYCDHIGIECFSAPFDKPSVDFLETLGCHRYKIASFELVDLDLIAYIARLGKPMIMSTGMATEKEILMAVRTVLTMCPDIDLTLVKCTSAYPADASDANLAAMDYFKSFKFGLSDHTPGIGVPIAAALHGANYIEKHLTLSRADGGPDAEFSLEPHEFAQMVTEIHRAIASIGEVKFGPVDGDASALRRSLHFARPLKHGHIITDEDICSARPFEGLSCWRREGIIGLKVTKDVERGEPVKQNFLCAA